MTVILQSFWMWWHVVWYICANIAKEPSASIFRMEEEDDGDNRFPQNVSTTFGSGANDTLIWKCHASTTLKYPIVKPLCFIKHHTWKAYIYIYIYIYRVSQEECARLQENVPYGKVHRYNPKHLYAKLNGYGDNGERSLKVWQLLHTYWLPNTH